MKRVELISKMADDAGIGKKEAEAALKSLIENIVKAIKKKNGNFKLVGFGAFSTVSRKARKGRNPRTGETIKIKACKVVKFKASKKLNGSV